jgi:hypothetical protein
MISQDSNDPKKPAAPAGKTETPPVLDPHNPIEVASQGGSTIDDPSGADKKPPGNDGSDYDYPV